MKLTLILILIFSYLSSFSQQIDSELLDKIYKNGERFTAPLKNGEIESLRNGNPPANTWKFSKLEDYKKNINSSDLIYGVIIMPSSIKSSNLYSYNLFAYDTKKEFYHFVAIVSYKVTKTDVKFDSSFLFTEMQAQKDWWTKTFSYYQSDVIKEIPKKYLFETCPPPPFKTE